MATNLRIQDKKQKNLLTLKAITEKEKFPDLVEKKEGKITLISEEKTYYLYLNKQAADYNFHKIYNFFVNFSRNNERDINVEAKSFVSDNLKEETVIQAISEGVLFGGHSSVTCKTDKKKPKFTIYYLITANKQTETVNAGSHHEPRVVIMRYKGNPKSKEILGLVGKGITFDSGGYDLKSSQYLQCMKFDMSGAAAVCASVWSLAQQKSKINVVAIACLTENAIGGHATLTESVIKSMNGKTVEINNTDAEGRLVLADGITYAIRKEKATRILTVATLTGAVVAALGENLTGVLTNNRKFYRELRQAFAKSHERY
ncbi:3237_t:CDS:2 [Entrophospora sp. SA101]|nr:3237_t:CDS:2 [Entrophospora sp. SA101]